MDAAATCNWQIMYYVYHELYNCSPHDNTQQIVADHHHIVIAINITNIVIKSTVPRISAVVTDQLHHHHHRRHLYNLIVPINISTAFQNHNRQAVLATVFSYGVLCIAVLVTISLKPGGGCVDNVQRVNKVGYLFSS